MALPKLVIFLELFNQKTFSCGQFYVALIRTTSLEGWYLKGPVTESIFVPSQMSLGIMNTSYHVKMH